MTTISPNPFRLLTGEGDNTAPELEQSSMGQALGLPRAVVEERGGMTEALASIRQPRDAFAVSQPPLVARAPAPAAPPVPASAPPPMKVMAGVSSPLPAKVNSNGASARDGWLALTDPKAQADYKLIIPTKRLEDPNGSSMAQSLDLQVRRVPDTERLEKLDLVYQMPTSFRSVAEAMAWKPKVAASTGDVLEVARRSALSLPPFSGLATLPPQERAKVLADPRRAYAAKLGLLDGSMPPPIPPLPSSAGPNAVLYLTDSSQQALVKAKVPPLVMGQGVMGGPPETEPNAPLLESLEVLYRLPTSFGSPAAAAAWSPPPMDASARDFTSTNFNATVAKQKPWSQLGLLPPEVQKGIARDPRLAYAGLKGLTAGPIPAGYKPMESQLVPSGRYVSFDSKMGGYDPKWAAQTKWVEGVGIVIPKDAVFVPYQYKPDLIGDVLLPAAASVAASFVFSPAGPILGGALTGAGNAMVSDGNASILRGAFLGAVGGGLNLASSGLSQTLGAALGNQTAGTITSRAILGGIQNAIGGGDVGRGALAGAVGGIVDAAAPAVTNALGGSAAAQATVNVVGSAITSAVGGGSAVSGAFSGLLASVGGTLRTPEVSVTDSAPPEQIALSGPDEAVVGSVKRDPVEATELPVEGPTARPLPATHVIARGETLSGIAKALFGNADRWPELYQANRDVLGSDPNQVPVGARLVVPSADYRVSSAEYAALVQRASMPDLFIGGIKPSDIVQGGVVANCYAIATFSAYAAAQPNVIREAIEPLGNDVYRVRLYQPTSSTDDTPRAVYVEVDAKKALMPSPAFRASSANPKELWGPVLERAWATLNGIEPAQASHGFAEDVMYALSGKPTGRTLMHAWNTTDQLFDELRTNVKNKVPMVAMTTKAPETLPLGLMTEHGYTVLAAFESNGKKYVTLRNPWGAPDRPNGATFTLTIEAFQKAAVLTVQAGK